MRSQKSERKRKVHEVEGKNREKKGKTSAYITLST